MYAFYLTKKKKGSQTLKKSKFMPICILELNYRLFSNFNRQGIREAENRAMLEMFWKYNKIITKGDIIM